MTTHKEALKLALDFVEDVYLGEWRGPTERQEEVISAIKEALAQPEPSPEWMTEEEQTAYTFGWFKALEQKRLEQPKEPEQEPVAKAMTAHRAAYFMERFKHEEKLLGPNEQAALDFVISMLEAQPAVAEQHKQEPWGACVSGRVFVGNLPDYVRVIAEDEGLPIQWLYTTPPQRKPLTDEEIERIRIKQGFTDWNISENAFKHVARAIEAAHGIKE